MIKMANELHNQHINLLNRLVATGELPEEPLSQHLIEFFFQQFAVMDSNNYLDKLGMGEREARVSSDMLTSRYFSLLHGIGRSGELLATQPKAIGSSLMQQVTHGLLKSALGVIGLGHIGDVLILPVCTGMALTLCFLNLKMKKPKAKYVIFLRIDQKSCIKSIYAAGLEPILIENIVGTKTAYGGSTDMSKIPNQSKNQSSDSQQEVFGLETNIDQLRHTLDSYDPEEILCVFSTTSCFAPRQPDDVVAVGKLAKDKKLFHVVNNAYGLQCLKTIDMLNKASSDDLIDYIVQSTDKNFLVPVGGSIVISKNKKLVKEVNNNYPGRASANIVIDLFISLLSLGKSGLRQKLKDRKESFDLLKAGLRELACSVSETVIESPRNKISIAFTLRNFGDKAEDFGARLFHRGIMGARVVKQDNTEKKINSLSLKNFGGHINSHYQGFPYVTVAAAIGIEPKEVEAFLKKFRKAYIEFAEEVRKQSPHLQNEQNTQGENSGVN